MPSFILNSVFIAQLFIAQLFIVPAEAAPSNFEKALKKLEKSGVKISAEVVNLTTTRTLLKVNEERTLNPASSIKLITAYVALKRLGINYQFKTEFYRNSDQSLCVKGDGDPSFVMEDLYLVVEALKRKGLESYNGKITVDASAFDDEFYPEDRSDQNSERAYNAPIAGLNFNYNTITAYVYPTTQGKPARVGLDFPFTFVDIRNKVVTGGTTNVTWDKKGSGSKEIVNLGGKINDDVEEWKKPFRIRHPAMAFGDALAQMLKQGGVSASSKVEITKGACKGSPMWVHASRPLSFIVMLMNKYSNNFIADALVKKLDQVVNKRTGTAAGGMKFIQDEMLKVQIDLKKEGRKVVSGSGLTRDNLLAASDFTALLRVINKEKYLLPELFASLPIAGMDGTLKRKYLGSDVQDRLRGKTGTLTGVQSLVGIYPNKSGEWIGISILVNGGSIPESELARYLATLD